MTESGPATNKVLAISHACVRAVNRKVYIELKRRGLNIELLVPTGVMLGGRWIETEPIEPNGPVVHLRPMLGAHGRLFRFPDINEVLGTIDPAIVFVEADTASKLTLDVAKWCRRSGRKLVCRTAENLSWRLDEAVARVGWRELPHAVLKSVLNWRVKRDVQVVCVTSEQSADLFHRAGFKRAVFMPMGTDRSVFRYNGRHRRQTRTALGIGEKELVVAYYGRIVPEKGVDTLVRAVSLLKDLKWRLLLNKFEYVTGYTATIEQLIADLGLEERVIWASSRHGAIAKLMTASDLAVLPSRTTSKWVEQYGRVVPEAMACGNLMVVSDSGAPKELVGDAGLVFPEGDHEALAEALRKMSARPGGCLHLRLAAIRHVQRKLSVTVEADAYEQIFTKAVEPA